MDKQYNLQGLCPDILTNVRTVCELSDTIEELLYHTNLLKGIVNHAYLSDGNHLHHYFKEFREKALQICSNYRAYLGHYIGHYNVDLYKFMIFPPYWTIKGLRFTTESMIKRLIALFEKKQLGHYKDQINFHGDNIIQTISLIESFRA